MNRVRTRNSLLLAASFFVAQALTTTAPAQTFTWDGIGPDFWDIPTNWTPSGIPDAAGEEVVFGPLGSGLNVQILAPRVVGTVTIDDSRNYSITGSNTLTLDVSTGSAAITVGNSNGNGAHSINADVSLADDVVITNNSTGTLTLGGVISGSNGVTTSGAGNVTFTGDNTYSGGTMINAGTLQVGNGGTTGSLTGNVSNNGTLTFNRSDNVTFNNVISGTGNLIKIGTGDLELNGANTYTGTTTVSAGQLTIGDNSNINLDALANSAVTVNAGATLRLEDDEENDFFAFGSLAGAGNYLTNGASAEIGGNDTSTTFSGSLGRVDDDKNSVVEKVGTGTWTLTGSGHDLFQLLVSEGTLVLDEVSGSVDEFQVNNSGHLTIQNTNALSLEKLFIREGGTALITGSSTDLNIQDRLTNRDTLTIADGASVTIKELVQATSMNSTIVDEASLTIERFDSSQRGGTLAISDASGGTALTVGDSINTAFEGGIEDHSTGPGSVSKTGSGTITFFGANTYSGTTTIEEGTLRIGNSLALQNTTVSIGVNDGLDVNGLDATLGGLAGSGNLNFDTTTLSVGNNNADTTYSGALSGTGTFAKIGTGTLTLTGSGHALSELDVNGGGLIIDGASGSFGAIEAAFGQEITIQNTTSAFEATSLTTILTSTMTINNAQVLGVSAFDNRGTLILENGSALSVAMFGQGGSGQTIVDHSSLSIGSFGPLIRGTIALSDPNGGPALTVGTDSGTTSFLGIISDYTNGPGSVTKTGNSTVVFAGANTYSGTTTIEDGVLRIGNSLALQNTTVSIGVDNGLDVDGFDATLGGLEGTGNLNLGSTSFTIGNNNANTTYAGRITGSGGELTKTGSGTLTLTGNNTFNGGTTITSGTLQVGDGGTTGTIRDVTNNGTLVFNRSNDYGFTHDISGTGNLVKTGDGELSLNGQTTYSGTTTVSAGILSISSGNSNGLANSAVTVEAGATLEFSIGFTDYAAGSLAGAGRVDLGGNDVTVGGNNLSTTFAGSITGDDSISYILTKEGTGTWTLTGSVQDLEQLEVTEGKVVLDGTKGQLGDLLVADNGELEIQNTSSDLNLVEVSNRGATLIRGGSTVVDTLDRIENRGSLTIKAGAHLTTDEFFQTSGETTIVNEASLTIGLVDSVRPGTIAISDASGGGPALTLGDSSNQSFNGVIEDHSTGSGSVLKTGSGTVTLSGANTYSGGTTIEEGTLRLGSSTAAGSGTILIDGGTLDLGSQTMANDLSFGASGGSITGTGTINTAVTLTSTNQVLDPGNSPGITMYGVNQTWESFTYLWELNDWTSAIAGTNFDQLQIDGSLSLTGSAVDNYNLDITSLTAGDIAGDVANFSEINQSWIILTTTTGITGFDADYWTILTDNFTSDPTFVGFFSLDVVGNDLVLTYTVPEPTSGALLATLAGVGLWARKRRRLASTIS